MSALGQNRPIRSGQSYDRIAPIAVIRCWAVSQSMSGGLWRLWAHPQKPIDLFRTKRALTKDRFRSLNVCFRTVDRG